LWSSSHIKGICLLQVVSSWLGKNLEYLCIRTDGETPVISIYLSVEADSLDREFRGNGSVNFSAFLK